MSLNYHQSLINSIWHGINCHDNEQKEEHDNEQKEQTLFY